jgi:thiol-disulfide isomerase/thioredoxin
MRFGHVDINKQAKMGKLINNQKVMAIIRILKPYVLMVVLLLVLRYTGALSYISEVGGTAVIKTGALDASIPDGTVKEKDFDYDFQVQDMAGNKVDFTQFKGKVVFLNLWATWCGPCRVEMPSIQELYSSLDSTQIKFVMLSIDNLENHEKVVKYVNDKNFTFPVYHQTLDYLPSQLQVRSIPTTFILGADGKIKAKKVGTTNFNTDEFKEYLKGLSGGL